MIKAVVDNSLLPRQLLKEAITAEQANTLREILRETIYHAFRDMAHDFGIEDDVPVEYLDDRASHLLERLFRITGGAGWDAAGEPSMTKMQAEMQRQMAVAALVSPMMTQMPSFVLETKLKD
jgi:hypothetical protein